MAVLESREIVNRTLLGLIYQIWLLLSVRCFMSKKTLWAIDKGDTDDQYGCNFEKPAKVANGNGNRNGILIIAVCF
jgi:hypothetical protein